MQLIIHLVFLFATALCTSNTSHYSTEEAKQVFVNGSELNSTDLKQETSTVSPRLYEDSKNEVPMIESKYVNETDELSIPFPSEKRLGKNGKKTAEEKKQEEKNQAPTVNPNISQCEAESNQTTNSTVKPETLLQLETSPTTMFNCSIMWPECTNPHEALDDTSRELTKFTLELYRSVSSALEQSNIVISPIGIAVGLSQLMLGSSGKTREDMLKLIFGGMKDSQCVHNAIWNLTKQNSFVSANELFFTKDISLKEEFIKQSERFYGSKGIHLNKEKKKNLDVINQWVSTKTNQLIRILFKELPEFELMLINILYYKGKWANRFDPNLTKKDIFKTTPSSKVRIPMMNNHKYPLQSIRDTYLQAHVARLPLSDNCSFIIFLPLSQEKDALKMVESRLTEEIVSLLMTQLEEKSPRATSVSIPKLKLSSDFGLTDTLSSLGLYNLFENPDFCALSDSPELALSDVRHQAILEITEDGAKAAAATSVTVARTMSLFSVERPFLYILANDINKIPLLIGRVTDPSK